MTLVVCHLIDSLAQGGAESVVRDIVDRSTVDHTVCYFRDVNTLADDVEEAGAETIPLEQRHPYDPKSLYRLWLTLRRQSPDILHVHLPYPRTVGRIVGKLAGINNIVTTYHSEISYDRWSVAYVIDPVVGRLDDTSVSVSDGIQGAYRKRLSGNSWQTIHNGVDVKAFEEAVSEADQKQLRTSLGISSDETVLLSVGRYVPEKCHETLIRAMPSILDVYSEAHLVLVGWGPLEETLRETAVEQGVPEAVTVTGQILDVHKYYALADVFGLASSSEGFGIVAVEAMAAGLPVVASDIPGLNEIIEDGETGYLVPPESPSAFASAICSILNGNGDQFGSEGYVRAKTRYDLSQTIAAYDRLYNDLID